MIPSAKFYPCIFSLLIVAAAVSLQGCATPARTAGGRAPTVAVIAGVPDDANKAIAELVAESLQRQSKQQPVSNEQIAKKLTSYPQYIQGPYQRAYFEIEVDWQRTDRAKISAALRELGVDYLYVVWAPNAVRNGALTDYIVWTPADIKAVDIHEVTVPLVVQLFAAPGARVVMKEQYVVYLDGAYKPNKMLFGDSIDSIALKLGKETGLIRGWW